MGNDITELSKGLENGGSGLTSPTGMVHSEGSVSAEIEKKIDEKTSFFLKPRGEPELYKNAKPTDEVVIPLTREGYDAIIDVACNYFTPPLPNDDSIRKVFSGYIHHLTNETNTITIEKIAKVLYKSISNALTWTIDQEIKQKQRAEIATLEAKAQAERTSAQAKLNQEKAKEKRQRKASKKVTVTESNEKAS